MKINGTLELYSQEQNWFSRGDRSTMLFLGKKRHVVPAGENFGSAPSIPELCRKTRLPIKIYEAETARRIYRIHTDF